MICNWILCRRRAADSHIWQHPAGPRTGSCSLGSAVQYSHPLLPGQFIMQSYKSLRTHVCHYYPDLNKWTDTVSEDWSMTKCCLPKGYYLSTHHHNEEAQSSYIVPTSDLEVYVVSSPCGWIFSGADGAVKVVTRDHSWPQNTFSDALNKRSAW